MTKVQLKFELARELDSKAMEAIANAHSYYGIHYVQLHPSLNSLVVEYDASRLTGTDVEATLHRAGVPVQRQLRP